MQSFEKKLQTYESVKTLIYIMLVISILLIAAWYFGATYVMPQIHSFQNQLMNAQQ